MPSILRLHLISLLIAIVNYLPQGSAATGQRIAIIGGGIGGTSAAYFLHELFKNEEQKIEIDLFEHEILGGRLSLEKIGKQEYETGGSIIHPRNKYMVNFRDRFGLKKRVEHSETMGIFNGNEFAFQGSSLDLITFGKLLWTYGYDVIRISRFVGKLIEDFSRIYDLQADGHAFTKVENLLAAMNPKFVGMISQTFGDFLKAEGFKDRFINELAEAVMRVNYGQSVTNTHAFVGAVSLAGAEGGLWAIEGGNRLITEAFYNYSNAKLQQIRVETIERNEAGKFILHCLDKNANSVLHTGYDNVIIASPQIPEQVGKLAPLKFVGLNVPKLSAPYHWLWTTLIQGNVAPQAFNAEKEPATMILTCNSSLPYNSVAVNFPVDSSDPNLLCYTDSSQRVWKVFSNEKVDGKLMNFLFHTVHQHKEVPHYAYPEYKYRKDFGELPPFEPIPGLYYINGIEWAASAMEMSVIGAKNVALLIKNRAHGAVHMIDSPKIYSLADESSHSEL